MTKLPDKVYASHIPGRSPALKIHASKALAMSAVNYQLYSSKPRGGNVYELGEDGWSLVASVPSSSGQHCLSLLEGEV